MKKVVQQQKRFQPKLKIKTGDTVEVIAGNDRGARGAVLKVFPLESRVMVEGVRIVKRHIKAQGGNPGQIIEKYAPIHISNVMLVDSKTDQTTRVGRVLNEDGKLVRFSKKSNEIID